MATANTQTDKNRPRMNFSADMAKRAEVDCPDCRGPGTAVIYKDRTPPHDLLAIECRVCGLYNDDFDSQNAQSADARERAAEEISHQGAGWYTLTDGTRVRGRDTAIDKQVALYATTPATPATPANDEDTA